MKTGPYFRILKIVFPESQFFKILSVIYILLVQNYFSNNFLQCVIFNEFICIWATKKLSDRLQVFLVKSTLWFCVFSKLIFYELNSS